MRKIHVGLELFLDGLMACELLAVVGGDRQGLVQIGLQQRNRGFRDDLGMLAADLPDERELGYSVYDSHQRALMVFADDGIDLPTSRDGGSAVAGREPALPVAYTGL
jgi:hypothetical protein